MGSFQSGGPTRFRRKARDVPKGIIPREVFDQKLASFRLRWFFGLSLLWQLRRRPGFHSRAQRLFEFQGPKGEWLLWFTLIHGLFRIRMKFLLSMIHFRLDTGLGLDHIRPHHGRE